MNIQLSLAIGGYDHVRDLLDGKVRAPGITLIPFELPIEEVTFRFTRFAEWDVSELSFGKTVALLSQDNPQIVPLPVFPSRVFRHSAIYVGDNGKITTPKDLEGRRVGIPEWAQTAGIYVRGLLQDEYGVDLRAVDWYQAGVRQPGRTEKVALKLPKGLRLTPVADKSLSEMLRSGELDAVISAREPAEGGRQFERMFPDYQALELAYFKKTRIFPIMHVVVLRRSTYERDRWIAMNLVQAFEAAKQRSLARTTELGVSHTPLPWVADHAARWRSLAGEDFWPYGVEANRPTLDAYLHYAFEQGVCHRRLTVDELFAPETREQAKI
jgi:4,5-dihydroxyphthalate decarboxylase